MSTIITINLPEETQHWDAEVRAWHEANAEARNLGPQPRR